MGTVFNRILTACILFSGFLIATYAQEECDTNYEDCNLQTYGKARMPKKCTIENVENCKRECTGEPKICHITLHVEPYTTMGPACGDCPSNKTACLDPQCITGDGTEKHVLVANRMIPGPPIEVCQGDTIVADVINADAHRSTSIHWHGIRQMKTPFSDGVPGVTQCPINPGQTFRYQFHAEEPGSYFYHSHSGVQKIDGLTGPLIIRAKKSNEIHGNLYDYDNNYLFIQDYIHCSADSKIPGIQKGVCSGSAPDSYLINGKGVYAGSTTDPQQLISVVGDPKQPPIYELNFEVNKRYRLRLISSTCLACTVKISIQGHSMTVINVDAAGPVEPYTVDSISLNSGDRFDVIIEANRVVDSYWILAQGQGSCNDAMQVALLRYEGAQNLPSSNLPLVVENGLILNPSNSDCSKAEDICVTKLSSSYRPPTSIVNAVCTHKMTMKFGFVFVSKKDQFQNNTFNPYFEPAVPLLLRAQINDISNKFPPSPLLSQYHDVKDNMFCPKNCYDQDLDCICLNVYKVPLNALVDMIVADTATSSAAGLNHPFHLHGFNFYVLKEGIFTNGIEEGLKELNEWLDKGPMVNRSDAVQKDTIGVPSGGYVVIRFRADNPGFWIFHCHFTVHLDTGMSAVMKVGNVRDMRKPPKGFPKCGDFKPPIYC